MQISVVDDDRGCDDQPIGKRKVEQGGKTYSATAAPFLETVLASTTNTTAFASLKWSRYWTLMRGWPGTSTAWTGCFFGSAIRLEFVCNEACVGSCWWNASCTTRFSTILESGYLQRGILTHRREDGCFSGIGSSNKQHGVPGGFGISPGKQSYHFGESRISPHWRR